MNRLYNLDYLRGISAFGIMLFHYFTWEFGKFSSDTIIERIGIYGVSIFYILSGLTLHYVYYDKMKPDFSDILSFTKKRILRIFPLLWLVTIATIILSKQTPNFFDLFLNLTGLFGFVKWDTYFSPGVWSIGNELVFYSFFPLFIFLTKSHKYLMSLFALTILACYLYFAFIKLDPNLNLSFQYNNYVNPLNQFFLFLGGFLIGFAFHKNKINVTLNLIILLIGLLLFVFYPSQGDSINLVTGINRLVFTFSCFLICFCFYKLQIKLPNIVHKPLTLLGEASYSVYLLHPIIYSVLGIILNKTANDTFQLPVTVKIILAITSTLIISNFVYEYFEKYFFKMGRKQKKLKML